jgi:ribosomal protein S27E
LNSKDVTRVLALENNETLLNVWNGSFQSIVANEKFDGYGALVLTNLRLLWIEEDAIWFGTNRYLRFHIPREEIIAIYETGSFLNRGIGLKTNNGSYGFLISVPFDDFKQLISIEQNKEIVREKKLQLLKNYETAGKFEEAARICDEFEMWEKAGEYRRMAKTTYQISTAFNMEKNGTISCKCPNCSSSQAVETKSNLVKCQHCGNNYIIPKKILDMM